MGTLLYIANQRLPTEKAHGLQIAKMCEAFADAGISVELLVPTRQNGSPDKIFDYYGVQKNFSVTTISSPDFYWPNTLDRFSFFIKQWIAARRLVRVALSKKPDIVYSRDEFSVFLASFYADRPRILFEAHTFSSRRKLYYRRFQKAGVNIIAISKGIRDAFIAFGYNPENIFVAHDGVDIEQFNIDQSRTESRALLKLPLDKKIILYAGHLYPWKGAHVLADASQSLDDQHLVIFVGGTEKDFTQYKKTSASSNSIFLGHQSHDRIPTYLRAADIVVLPNSGKEVISRLYTSPLKMFEYMASGTPIIASDLPSIREILTDRNAFFFTADDSKALGERIREVALNEPEGQRRARQALHDVQGYSWKNRASQILQYVGIPHEK